uniref:VPS9 domain-containing protein n=1 Tax=Panagrolaimus sp. JU765 TaxID=591449 RepID=A0AC34Q9Z2_9BILA
MNEQKLWTKVCNNFVKKCRLKQCGRIWTKENWIVQGNKYLERSLMSYVYHSALYPNGDADQFPDEVFHKSLSELAKVITPDHPDLRISRRFHGECSWPSAQAEIAIINAYKSPRDKMTCIVKECREVKHIGGHNLFLLLNLSNKY